MKRNSIIITSVLLIMIMIGVFFVPNSINRFFDGDPTLREESIDIVADYLQTNYPEQSFNVESVAFYPSEGTFIVHIVSKDGKIKGNIDVRNGKVVGTELGNFSPGN